MRQRVKQLYQIQQVIIQFIRKVKLLRQGGKKRLKDGHSMIKMVKQPRVEYIPIYLLSQLMVQERVITGI